MRLHFILFSTVCAVAFACTRDLPSLVVPNISIPYDGGPRADGGVPDIIQYPDATVDLCGESTVGRTCTTNAQCDDRCFCNGLEQCVSGNCAEGANPCVDDVSCTDMSCAEEVDRCFVQPVDMRCSDGDACNGYETCDPENRLRTADGCRPASRMTCNDEDSCTIDDCDRARGCTHVIRDLDMDGFTDGRCGGMDCDDDPRYGGANIHPGAPEVCGNRRDDDCDGRRDFLDTECLPSNDTCATATVLPGPGTYSGSTRTLRANYNLGCATSAFGPDAVFRFTLPELQDVRVDVAGGPSFGSTAVAVRPFASCESEPSTRCGTGTNPSVRMRSLPAGEYAIVVKMSGEATFDLQLRFDPPTTAPAVDVCNAMTQDISAGGHINGLFEEIQDDFPISCHSGSHKDAVYRITIATPKDVLITATTESTFGGGSTYLALTPDCSVPSRTDSCVSGTFGSAATIRRRPLQPGTYFIVIEPGESGSNGYTLDVSVTDPVPRPVGDTCAMPLDITAAEGRVSLSMLDSDSPPSCAPTTSGFRDAIFSFTLTAQQDVDVFVTTPLFDHYAAVQTICGATGSELRCRNLTGTSTQSFRALDPGTYFVNVSAFGTSGDVRARVALRPPTPIPPNDRCAGAVDVSAGGSFRGTLMDFGDDLAGCPAVSGAPDAFYQLTVTTPQRLLAVATPTSAFAQMYLTLRGTCGPAPDLACGSGRPGSISQVVNPGTYYLFVETGSTTPTDFDLSVSFIPVATDAGTD